MQAGTIIMIAPSDLESMIEKAVAKIVPKLAEFQPEKAGFQIDTVNINDAAQFLTDCGLPMTRPALYSLVHTRRIPYRKIGHRLVFSRKDLVQWMEDNTETPETQENAAKRIAASANRKKS